MAREINLVPDIKGEMIKTLKLRNFIFFLCIVVSAGSIGFAAILGIIAGGQQTVINGKQSTIDNLSSRMNSYNDLSEFLTIKNQVEDVNILSNNKKVLSRTFSILSAIIPTGADSVKISKLSVNLEEEIPTFGFDAQADAGQEPFIDYNVLDSFKKSMKYMRYDYGKYVDKEGNNIPSYCIIENGTDGATLKDSEKGYYGLWTIEAEGCNPNKEDNEQSSNQSSSQSSSQNNGQSSSQNNNLDYSTEEYEGQNVVRIWRTPQFGEWYGSGNTGSLDTPTIDLKGEISNTPHFVSSCITYTGHESADYAAKPEETVIARLNGITWTSQNEECKLVPDANDEGTGGITISDSSNGRGNSDELVLRFTAAIEFNPAVFIFANEHFMAIPPSGRHNVTDSYVQIQAMFGERAADCEEGDTACANANNTNNNSNNSNNSNNNSNSNSNSNNNTNTNSDSKTNSTSGNTTKNGGK